MFVHIFNILASVINQNIYVFKQKRARKINEIIFWFIIEAEIGKKLPDSEKSGVSREKNWHTGKK